VAIDRASGTLKKMVRRYVFIFRCYAFRVKPVKITLDFSDNNSLQNVPTAFCHRRYCQRSRDPYHRHRLGEDCTLR
jgi:hypothetical protein